MIKPNYHCSQAQLYVVLQMGWDNYQQFLTVLNKIRPQFTAKFGEDAVARINKAAALPDKEARDEAAILLRQSLAEQARECRETWKMLKGYISYAFEDGSEKSRWTAAGWNYYDSASNENWAATNAMMISGQSYLDANLVSLRANDNMPESFVTDFVSVKNAFIEVYKNFLAAEQSSQKKTEVKIEANNACYKECLKMFSVAVDAFENDDENRKLFIFSEILQKVAGAGTPGVSGIVLDAETSLPLEGVEATIENRKNNDKTNAKGRYEMLQIATGVYKLILNKKGYKTLSILFEIPDTTVKQMDALRMEREIITEE